MKHQVTFLPKNVTVEVDDADYPYGDHGKPGSLLDIALENGIDLPHNCGGSCACTTCHVIVRAGEDNLSEMEEDDQMSQGTGALGVLREETMQEILMCSSGEW